MNARDRGALILKLAELMDEHKEELATIETIDSGAVYTLALKTHVGMSIDTWKYFAGWCDKVKLYISLQQNTLSNGACTGFISSEAEILIFFPVSLFIIFP